jgi:FMN-dependent oxidoreductase (nitrilotriacetate monooxygenase family)
MINLVFMPNAGGGHLGGWRHPDAWTDTVANLDHIVEATRIAESGCFDTIFFADGNAVRDMHHPALFAANSPSARPAGFEPTTLLAAIAMQTRHIGLVATSTTTYDEPYMVARRFASLDLLSQGRAGWNLVTTSYAGDSKNFGRADHMQRDERYERAAEFIEVVKGLWDSWSPDAFPQDKATGQFLDPAKVRMLNHHGKHFDVQGPLNVPRTPQGYPVVFMAGQSGPGRELAAQHADALFAAGDSKESCQEAYADIKSRMAKYGRKPEHLRFIPGISVFVGRTAAEADALFAELQALISPELGVHYLSKMVNRDLSGFPLDGPMPEMPPEQVGGTSLRTYIILMAQREDLTIRQTYERVLPSLGHPVFKGDPVQVADQMEEWIRDSACDGFMISAPYMPHCLKAFVELVVPELQRRGLHRTAYGAKLRETMGLPMPALPDFSSAQAAE